MFWLHLLSPPPTVSSQLPFTERWMPAPLADSAWNGGGGRINAPGLCVTWKIMKGCIVAPSYSFSPAAGPKALLPPGNLSEPELQAIPFCAGGRGLCTLPTWQCQSFGRADNLGEYKLIPALHFTHEGSTLGLTIMCSWGLLGRVPHFTT